MMSIGVLTLAALVVAIIISCVSPINIGFLAISLSYIIGTLLVGMTFKQLMAGLPLNLFLILSGATLLFAQAQIGFLSIIIFF